MFPSKRIAAVGAVAGLAALGVAAMPSQANAWWRGPGFGISLWVPPVVVAPAPVYAPPPVYYAPPPASYAPPPASLRCAARRVLRWAAAVPARVGAAALGERRLGCRSLGVTVRPWTGPPDYRGPDHLGPDHLGPDHRKA